ncbi:MAG TPA: hypothetical protein VE646_14165 [Actinomycetota bacterium]|jgi:hypothetical protein|nr:hypothetical protein [Actinomycetota bacterium]
MATDTELAELCRAALDAESDWRYRGAEGRRAAYERFQQLVRTIAEATGRSYEEAFNEAIEQWVKEHFCAVAGEG